MKILEYVDVFVLILVVAAGAWVFMTGAGTKADETAAALARADEAITGLEAAIDYDGYEGSDGEIVLDHLESLPAEVERQWNPAAVDKDFPGGVFYHPDSLADLRDGRDLELRFLPPLGLAAAAELGEIALTFQSNDRSTVFVTGYRIYRTGGDGVEKLVAEIDGASTSWVDRDVLAGHLYSYRVSAVTDEEILVERKKDESPRSSAVSVRGKRDYEIIPESWDAEARTMRVRVRKHRDGVWHEKLFDAKEKAGIGAVDPGSGIDYATACTVERFEAGTENVEETRDEVSFDLDGRVLTADDGQPITARRTYNRPRTVVVLLIRNELGQVERIEHRP